MVDEFDAAQRIAGFPLVKIKKVLTYVGLIDDRDDLKTVSETLACSPRQAARVLDELERRGFVTATKKRNQWTTTREGNRLAHHWQPPRRFRPAIERDDRNNPTSEGLEEVPCLILRATDDDEDAFEEAYLDATFCTDYEGEHLVEVSVTQPDDYDDPGSAIIALSLYMAPADARVIAAGLQKAADMADAEIARRAKHPPKHRPVPKRSPKPASVPSLENETPRTPAAPPKPRVDAQAKKKEREALAATLAELRGPAHPGRGRKQR